MFLRVSASPHIRYHEDTAHIMRHVCYALLPAVAAATLIFGVDALAITAVSVASCLFFEALSCFLMKRRQSIGDGSAVVTGLILGLNLPATLPVWMAVVGSFFAIVVVKQAFGGLGKNFMNPALAARVFMLISFPGAMTTFALRKSVLGIDLVTGPLSSSLASPLFPEVDLVTFATPLTLIRTKETLPPLWHMFLGLKNGVIGEVSGAALLLGAAWLIYKKIISVEIPIAFIGTTLIFVTLMGQDPIAHLLSGGLLFGAFFMATDFVTNPITFRGKILFGIGCGLITGLIRIFGSSNEGVSYAILFMNVLTPHIDRLTHRFPRKNKPRLDIGTTGSDGAVK